MIVTPLRQIHDERGKVMHMLRCDDAIFSSFGEIYFSCVLPKAIKAWKRHTKMTMNCTVVHGQVKFVLFDDRPGSSTKGCVEVYALSPENYCLITVPPLVWTGFQGVDDTIAILANCATIPHVSGESETKSSADRSIPYNW